jgi:hypothetical protein
MSLGTASDRPDCLEISGWVTPNRLYAPTSADDGLWVPQEIRRDLFPRAGGDGARPMRWFMWRAAPGDEAVTPQSLGWL